MRDSQLLCEHSDDVVNRPNCKGTNHEVGMDQMHGALMAALSSGG